MSIKISFTANSPKQSDTAVILVFSSKKPSFSFSKPDKKTGGLIAQALKRAKNFTGKSGETITLNLSAAEGFKQIVCLGLGVAETLDGLKAETAGGRLYKTLESAGVSRAVLFVEDSKELKIIKPSELAARLAAGFQLRSYKFGRYKSAQKNKNELTRLDIATRNPAQAKASFSNLEKTLQGVFLARDLVNEPPNHLYPDSFAQRLKKELTPLGVRIDILDEKKMQALGMGAILAVGMGSVYKPRIVVMRWNGLTGKAAKRGPLALVGKGVTFDSGGISIKPAADMHEMKMDMGGAAAVAGTIMALALRKARTDVVGIIGLAENMLSQDAYRPADIIRSYAGKTIEVLNTDAEGRLVLADILTYVQEKYKPRMIIDLATLTGAMMVALGQEYCGAFCNDDPLWSQLEQAGRRSGEKIWRMPLDEVWKKDMESEIADLQNIGKMGRLAGACTGAGFLEHFIEGDTPWAHLDIAGTAWAKADRPTVPKYGTGFGVRLLESLIADHHEAP